MSKPLRSLITFLIGTATLVGLPLVGWGITDMEGFVRNPARLAYAVLVVLLNIYASVKIPEVGKERPKEKTVIGRQNLAVVLMQIISMLAVVVGPYCDRRQLGILGGGDALRYAGLVLYLCGFWVMHRTEAHLGKQFTVKVALQEGHRLITDGPYRHLRHPRYLGVILFLLGICLVFTSAWSLICVAAMVVVFAWRISDEEELLHREFG